MEGIVDRSETGIVRDGLTYPFRGDGWLRPFLVGSALSYLLVVLALLPLVPLLGYFERVLAHTAAGDDTPPPFTEPVELIRRGLGKGAVVVVYGAIPYVVATVVLVGLVAVFGTGLLAGAAIFDTSSGGGLAALLLSIGTSLLAAILVPLLIYALATVLAFYLVPAATMNYAVEGSLLAAFDVRDLLEIVTSPAYLVAMVVPLAIQWATHTVAGLLTSTVVALVVVPPIAFYAHVAIYRMYGRAYLAAVE